MPDQLEQLFAELRTETVAQVRPPGTAAAYRTVRRRRIVTTSAVATAVAVAVGGIFALGLPTRRDSPQPAQRPEVDTGAAVEQALARDAQPGDPGATGLYDPRDTQELVRPGVAAGTYNLYLACSDDRWLVVRIRVGIGPTHMITVGCSANPQVVKVPLRLDKTSDIFTSFSGPGGPMAGYKLVKSTNADDTLVPSAESTSNSVSAAITLSSRGVADPVPGTTESDAILHLGALDAGGWHLSIACAGQGKISVTVTEAVPSGSLNTPAGDGLECTQAGAVLDMLGSVTFARSEVTLTVSPDASAKNHAGFAWAMSAG